MKLFFRTHYSSFLSWSSHFRKRTTPLGSTIKWSLPQNMGNPSSEHLVETDSQSKSKICGQPGEPHCIGRLPFFITVTFCSKLQVSDTCSHFYGLAYLPKDVEGFTTQRWGHPSCSFGKLEAFFRKLSNKKDLKTQFLYIYFRKWSFFSNSLFIFSELIATFENGPPPREYHQMITSSKYEQPK